MTGKLPKDAAIAVTAGGPCKLVVYVVLHDDGAAGCIAGDNNNNKYAALYCTVNLKKAMQNSIKAGLNPLFGISDVVITESLPRTASNKIMRRLLRDDYVANASAATAAAMKN